MASAVLSFVNKNATAVISDTFIDIQGHFVFVTFIGLNHRFDGSR